MRNIHNKTVSKTVRYDLEPTRCFGVSFLGQRQRCPSSCQVVLTTPYSCINRGMHGVDTKFTMSFSLGLVVVPVVLRKEVPLVVLEVVPLVVLQGDVMMTSPFTKFASVQHDTGGRG
jgi:hypothetical protein